MLNEDPVRYIIIYMVSSHESEAAIAAELRRLLSAEKRRLLRIRECPMIEPELAKKFIERLTQYTEYNINIMNESGVIIASRDPSRVGTYHEVADRIIRGEQDMIVIRDDKEFPGVLPGINMAVTHQGRKEGVIGVTGDPDAIRDVALITRLALETMLRYEKQQEEIRLRRNRKEHFLNILTQKEYADSSELRGIARQLALDESLVRVPIVVRLFGADHSDKDLPNPEEALLELRHGKGHWVQDFSAVMDETHLVVFKTVKVDGRRNFVAYREELDDYLSHIRAWLRKQGARAVFYVGSLQNAFTQYYYAYRHCKWLESHLREPDGIVFFSDYVREYFRTLIPRQELQKAFLIYAQEMPEDTRKQFTEMMRAFEETNYNLSESAAKLFIHKNTLIYRYNKFKDMLGVDPLERSMDRGFMELLYMYLAK